MQDEEEKLDAAGVDGVGWDGVVLEADGVVEADEHDDGHEGVPDELHEEV